MLTEEGFNIIAAVDLNWAIGKKNELLVSVPEDRHLFLKETLGKAVVMGRNTFESLPGRQPLYGRDNIVLSRNRAFSPEGVTVKSSMEETLEYLKKYRGEEVYVIGGESIFRQFLPYCSAAEITCIDYAYDGDRFFPNLERDPEWELTGESDEETYFSLAYTFRLYHRTA